MSNEIEKPNDLYKMKFHEILNITKWINVTRVPGGWIYSFNYPTDEGTDYGVFVPFDNEFQSQHPQKGRK